MKRIVSFTEQSMVRGESPKPMLYKIIKISGIIFILGILLDIWIDGFSFKIISDYILPLFLLSYCSKVLAPRNKVVQIQNNLSVEGNELVYEVIGIGDENRRAIFPINSIANVLFKEKDRVIVIDGIARVEVVNLKTGKATVENFNGTKRSIDVKIGNLDKTKTLSDLRSVLRCNIQEIN